MTSPKQWWSAKKTARDAWWETHPRLAKTRRVYTLAAMIRSKAKMVASKAAAAGLVTIPATAAVALGVTIAAYKTGTTSGYRDCVTARTARIVTAAAAHPGSTPNNYPPPTASTPPSAPVPDPTAPPPDPTAPPPDPTAPTAPTAPVTDDTAPVFDTNPGQPDNTTTATPTGTGTATPGTRGTGPVTGPVTGTRPGTGTTATNFILQSKADLTEANQTAAAKGIDEDPDHNPNPITGTPDPSEPSATATPPTTAPSTATTFAATTTPATEPTTTTEPATTTTFDLTAPCTTPTPNPTPTPFIAFLTATGLLLTYTATRLIRRDF